MTGGSMEGESLTPMTASTGGINWNNNIFDLYTLLQYLFPYTLNSPSLLRPSWCD